MSPWSKHGVKASDLLPPEKGAKASGPSFAAQLRALVDAQQPQTAEEFFKWKDAQIAAAREEKS